MEESIKEKQPSRTSISKTENGFTTDIRVEEIDNGFLVTTSKYGEVNGKYESKETKTFSKTNPLEEEEEKEENETGKLAKGIKGLLNSLASDEGMLEV